MTAAVTIRQLSVLRGRLTAMHDASFTIEAGSWFGLIGANGSGKTSLLRAIAGRLPIHAGRCLIDGVDVTDDRGARAKAIGFAPSVEMLPDALSGGEVLQIIAGDRNDALARLGPLRMALGVDPLLDRSVGVCSAGMRQRVAIACAFAAGHRIVILDEPFNWLDPVAAYDVRRALRAMADEGLTLVTALHDLTTFITACDRGVLLGDGRVALAVDHAAMRRAVHNPADFERRTIDLLRSAGGP